MVNRKVSEYRKGKIVYRLERCAGVVSGILLLVSLFLGGSALAQETKSEELQLKPLGDSGVSGTATLTNVEGGVQVKLEIKGLPEAGVEHINHFHGGGTCADVQGGNMAPVTIPLKPIVAQEDGTGSATTTLEDVTLDKLFGGDQDRFVLVHAKTKEGQGVPPGISCVDLPKRSGNTNGFESLPASGGFPPAVLLVAPLVLVLATVAGLLVVWRRIA
jgi:Cu/Zn superoxide dismutase